MIAYLIAGTAIAATVYAVARKRRQNEEENSNSSMTPTNTTSTGTPPNPSGATRGLRNNNPLNIEWNSTNWQGEIKPSSDSRFAQFVSMPYGYRAAFKTIRTYITKHGVKTVQDIIHRWDSGAKTYVSNVCKWTGFSPDKVINPDNSADMINLVSAMSRMENGIAANIQDVTDGYKLYRG